MSSTELIPFFPSVTHPAIPVAAQLLSALRHLTAPGRGNDLKPEERVALVGVSALLACEKLQLKDLIESSAQKASSVAPSHFRSALAVCRRLLLDKIDTPRKTSRPSSSRSSQSPKKSPPPLNLKTTPKKPTPFDLFSPLRPNSPSVGSPLKQSTTPSKAAHTSYLAKSMSDDKNEEDEIQTPTKKVKYSVPVTSTERSTRKKDDFSAFLALRPGASPQSGHSSVQAEKVLPTRESLGFVTRRTTRRRTEKRKFKPRRDWTYKESSWGGTAVDEENDRFLDQIRKVFPKWCESHNVSAPSLTDNISVLELLLAGAPEERGEDAGEEMDST